MDYGYTTTYSTTGGANGGGFMPGSQTDSPSSKRKYGLDTLRPVTIKQLLDAYHPAPDAEHFMIDNVEATQVTFVGQVRNISVQATNTMYKLDDGTGTIEVKTWKDQEADNDPDHPSNQRVMPTEQSYVRVWGRLKQFNNKRHLGAQVIRPIQDFNEVQYHLLEATAVHLYFTKGPLEQGKGSANGMANGQAAGQQMQQNGGGGGGGLAAGASASARRVYQCLRETEQTNEGLHVQNIAQQLHMEISEVQKAGAELTNLGAIYTTVDDYTWAVLDLDG